MRVFNRSEIKLYDVWHTLGANFLRHVLSKTATMERINAPSIFNIMSSNLASLSNNKDIK